MNKGFFVVEIMMAVVIAIFILILAYTIMPVLYAIVGLSIYANDPVVGAIQYLAPIVFVAMLVWGAYTVVTNSA